VIDLDTATVFAPARLAAGIDREVQLEDLPQVTVELHWISPPSGTRHTCEGLANSSGLGGGVYIATDAAGMPLKVGMTEDFADRARRYKTSERGRYIKMLADKKGVESDSSKWEFHIAKITKGAGEVPRLIKGYGIHVENAIARAFLRAKYALPAHKSPVVVANVLGAVDIKNLLPPPPAFPLLLRHAYEAKKDVRGRSVTHYGSGPALSNRLSLIPSKGKRLTWEAE